MKGKLYSYSHLETARSIFPERVERKEWLAEMWKDEEINACKQVELREFIQSPSLATHPIKDLCSPDAPMPGDLLIVNEYLANNKEIRKFLSIGCGLGNKELMLAKSNPQVSFVAVDNAPYVESLNAVAAELKLTNIKFIRTIDIREAKLGKFDVVYSFSVIYCIPDEFLASYFEYIMSGLNPHGLAFVGCNDFPIKSKIASLIRSTFPFLKRKNTKQLGWSRDIRHVKQFIPKEVTIDNLYRFPHFKETDIKSARTLSGGHAINFFKNKSSRKVNCYLFALKN